MQAVQGLKDGHLSHVSLRREDDRLQAVVRHCQRLLLHHFLQTSQNLSIRQLRVAQDGAAGLDGLDDLVRGIAGQRKAGRLGVDLHDPPERLLGSIGHADGKRDGGDTCVLISSLHDMRPGVSVVFVSLCPPVGLIQDDDLVSSFGQGDFLLSKHLDLVPHHVDAPGHKWS